MENKRDVEIDTMRKEAGIRMMELSNVIGVSYHTIVSRIGGFLRWQPGEREKIIKYIQDKKNENVAM